MLFTFGSCKSVQRKCRWNAGAHARLLLFVGLLVEATIAAMYDGDGDPCEVQGNAGVCRAQSQCAELEEKMKQLGLKARDVVSCGFLAFEELICCPGNTMPKPSPLQTTKQPTGTPKPTTLPRHNNRPAVRACETIDAGLSPGLSPHIIGGTPVELGEYPHMVAIGYSSIGNEQGPYDFRCGGSLIDARYVLTAAHCLIYRDSQPQIVRMGVTNFSDAEQMRNVVERRIVTTNIHPQYRSSSKYYDIAILELESDVESKNGIVHPICLYTEPEDPPSQLPLYVTGWGVVNTKTRQISNILLKAKQEIVSIQHCNESYVAIGLNRHLDVGIASTQMCTTDPELKRDACQGDSGGPLNLVLDESTYKYRLVGVISAGFGCASATPSLYTRVSAFLDYIESIVWPTRR